MQTTVQLHSRNILFNLFRKAIVTFEIATNPFGLRGSAPDPAA